MRCDPRGPQRSCPGALVLGILGLTGCHSLLPFVTVASDGAQGDGAAPSDGVAPGDGSGRMDLARPRDRGARDGTRDARPSYPVVTVDSVSKVSGGSSTLTVAHPTGSGANRLMLVGIAARASTGSYGTVYGVKYNGVSLTPVGSQQGLDHMKVWIYDLVAPPSGSYPLVVSWSGGNGAIVGVMTFFGVHPGTPLGLFVGTTGSSSTAAVNVTSASGEMVFDTIMPGEAGDPAKVGPGQTERWNQSGNYMQGAGSTEPGAATVTMSWTGLTDEWVLGAVAIRRAPGG